MMQPEKLRFGFGTATRFAVSLVQSVMALFATGTVGYEAHRLFLWYYAREWEGVQASGVNGCKGDEALANGDLFGGQTLCNQPENLVPWVEVYRHHMTVAALYFGTIITLLIAIGWLWLRSQKRSVAPDPTRQHPHGSPRSENTI